ncbi:phosphate starvation-inducible protein PhoH [Frankia sp. CcWB3]
MTRIAVDLVGEGSPSGPLLETLPSALDADPHLVLTLVTSGDAVRDDLARLGIVPGERVLLATAARGVSAGPEALREVRARRDSGVRVAARLVRDGHADAMVSVAPAEAVVASAQFTYGLLPGATRATLASIVGGSNAPVVLCDAGATVDVTADELAQFAVAGSAYAAVRFAVDAPRVGLLTARPAIPDTLRRAADELLRSLDLHYVGPLTADRLLAAPWTGEPGDGQRIDHRRGVDVAVTDGFTGDVLMSVIRGMRWWESHRGTGHPPRAGLDPGWGTLEDPDVRGGTIVLGVDGVAVHAERAPGEAGDSQAVGLLAALRAASAAVRVDLASRTRAAMATLVAHRRALAGLVG